ncbi:phosphatidylinositol-specific phospholipase C/glycerophosphodiester phosphodiesterase family protein [bacterium]|nr:phosphatidylinositol-specific phospholipase C/glycerophosphodiester phosphodiesterase family protein [bacterium]
MLGLFFVGSTIRSDDVTPVPQAHAHNDYAHARPLIDALDHGFGSVEADIFLVGNDLLVGHSRLELKKDRTLEKLYLDPLLERVRQHGGKVYKDGPPLVLLIDFKSTGEKTYARLREVLTRYREMLGHLEAGIWKAGAVTVVISGDRPQKTIADDAERMVGIDGRPGDLESTVASDLMPMISESWGSLFRWRGEGPMPTGEKEKLRQFVDKAHQRGSIVRFWATPEKESLWDELRSAKVDLINTDDLPRLRSYLLSPK